MTVAGSLFDQPAAPALGTASEWVTGVMLGSLAIALCVIAVAIVGLLLMTGRVAVRESAKVVVGCFVLLGAPVIAAGLRGVADGTSSADPIAEPVIVAPMEVPELQPADYDPYAGASLRRD
jgi:type IV secretion system protein VirB2